jgi:mono/diheme cytochrome c family protein
MNVGAHPAALLLAGSALAAGACTGSRASPDLYAGSCAQCHGASGTPSQAALKMGAPNFADAAWQKQRTDDDIRKKITDGGGRGMPSFEGFGPADLDGLVAYIRSLGPAQ